MNSERRSRSCWARWKKCSPCAASCRRPARNWRQSTHRNGLRLQKLVNTLLDFSRIEAGRMEPSIRSHRSGEADRGAGVDLPFGRGEGRAGTHGGLPAARRAGLRGPRDVGEGGAQPALQRLQVHVRRHGSRCGCEAEGGTREAFRRGYRHRHSGARTAAPVSSASTGWKGSAGKNAGRHRHRPGAGGRTGQTARWNGGGVEHGGAGKHLHGVDSVGNRGAAPGARADGGSRCLPRPMWRRRRTR